MARVSGAGKKQREEGGESDEGRWASWWSCPPGQHGGMAPVMVRRGRAGATATSGSVGRYRRKKKEKLQGAPCLKFYVYYILVQQAFRDLIEPLKHF